MASQHEEMSDQDELIADLLGQGWTHQRVADSVGASSKTVQRRMSDPAFSKVVSERRRERFGQLSGQLLTAGNSAMDVLTGALPVDIEPAAPRCSRSTGFMNIPPELWFANHELRFTAEVAPGCEPAQDTSGRGRLSEVLLEPIMEFVRGEVGEVVANLDAMQVVLHVGRKDGGAVALRSGWRDHHGANHTAIAACNDVELHENPPPWSEKVATP